MLRRVTSDGVARNVFLEFLPHLAQIAHLCAEHELGSDRPEEEQRAEEDGGMAETGDQDIHELDPDQRIADDYPRPEDVASLLRRQRRELVLLQLRPDGGHEGADELMGFSPIFRKSLRPTKKCSVSTPYALATK